MEAPYHHPHCEDGEPATPSTALTHTCPGQTDLETRPSQGQVAFGHKTPHFWSRSLSAPPPPTSPLLQQGTSAAPGLSPCLQSFVERALLCFPWSLAFLRRGWAAACPCQLRPHPTLSLSTWSLLRGLLPPLCGPWSLGPYLFSAAKLCVLGPGTRWGSSPCPPRVPGHVPECAIRRRSGGREDVGSGLEGWSVLAKV